MNHDWEQLAQLLAMFTIGWTIGHFTPRGGIMRITCPQCGRRVASWRVTSGSPAQGNAVKACDQCAMKKPCP